MPNLALVSQNAQQVCYTASLWGFGIDAFFGTVTVCFLLGISYAITGSEVALHCCKAHSKINGKMENSTPCKIVTPENFILKCGTRDYTSRTSPTKRIFMYRTSLQWGLVHK